MDLSIYDIILGPVITEKAYELNKQLKKLVLRVHPQANKPLVKEALEKLFDVRVKNVNISVRKGKNRSVGRRSIQGSMIKKAIVTLAEGYSLDLLDQTGAGVLSQEGKLRSHEARAE
jgi:large subunit ribosomal protein L23